MSLVVIAISCCAWIQAAGEGGRFEPQRSRRAAAAPIGEPADQPIEAAGDPAAEQPTEPAARDRSSEPSGRDRYAVPDDPQEPRSRAFDAEPPSRAGREEAREPAAQTEGGRQKPRPPELLADALQKPQEGALVGTPLALHAALGRGPDRQQQLRIAQAYWRLSTAQADYHWSLNHRDLLRHYTEHHTNSAGTLAARAAARADVRDAQLAVAEAQQQLADLMGSAADAAPLASDRPHVGDYRTAYENIFGNRQPPPRIRLIHRTLPVRRKSIDDHGEAIVAALDAVEATGEEFKSNGQGLATLLGALELLQQERRAFMADVRDYNQDIAEYALAVAPAGATEQVLAGMLIKSNSAPPARGARGAGTPLEGPPPRRDEPREAREQTSNYQPPDAPDEPGLYQGLLEVSKPAERIEKLANLLHWDRNLPADAATPITLTDCLAGSSPAGRMAVIVAYWRARERAAWYQAMNDQAEQLAGLPAIALGFREQPGMAAALLRVQATRRAARAAIDDALVQLLVAEFELTQVCGRRLDAPWLVPSTPPQSGRYLVASRGASGQAVSHWANIVLVQHEKLSERSDAVMQSDRHRAAMVNESRRGIEAEEAGARVLDEPLRIDGALRAIARQNRQTVSFLSDLTNYNIAIAHYALALFPPTISGEELVKKLVIPRSTRRDA